MEVFRNSFDDELACLLSKKTEQYEMLADRKGANELVVENLNSAITMRNQTRLYNSGKSIDLIANSAKGFQINQIIRLQQTFDVMV